MTGVGDAGMQLGRAGGRVAITRAGWDRQPVWRELLTAARTNNQAGVRRGRSGTRRRHYRGVAGQSNPRSAPVTSTNVYRRHTRR